MYKELTVEQTQNDTHNRYNSRLINKEDVIKPIIDYLKKELKKKSINTLSDIAFQLLYRKDKVLKKRIKLVYRLIMLEEKEDFLKYKNRLTKKG